MQRTMAIPDLRELLLVAANLGSALEQLRWYLEQWLLPTYAA